MTTSIPIRSPTCRTAVEAYAKRLREEGGLPLELQQVQPVSEEDPDGDGIVYIDWCTDALEEREAWDADDEEASDSQPVVSIRTVAQYHRNLLLLGLEETFAAAWLSRLRAPRQGQPGEAKG
jgi:hypothetical protein